VAQTNDQVPLGCWASLFALAVIIWFILPDSWTDPIWYSVEYSVNSAQVHWNPKPTDCDFIHAPLGDKGCHYKKTVTARNEAGYMVAGDDAPRYSKDTNTGKPIISYDKGKTWDWFTGDPDSKIKTVEIDWTKITE
jgi:hypothetical protein